MFFLHFLKKCRGIFRMECKLFSFFADLRNKTLATVKEISYNTMVYAQSLLRNATNRTMRGIDYMSASSKKKLRKEQNAAAMTEKQQKELKEAKNLKVMTFTFAVVMILVVAIVIGVFVRTPIAGAIDRNTHAITIGDHELSTTEFSYFYVDAINNYYKQVYQTYYSYYGSYWYLGLGFSTGTPLNEQKYTYGEEEDMTWADYFMDQAIESAKSTFAVYDLAMSENYQMTEDEQAEVDEYLNSLDTVASNYGYSSAKTYLRGNYGDGANVKTYKNYYTISAIAKSYYNAYAETLEYTDEDYRNYESDKFNNYSSFSYAVYTINVEDYLPEDAEEESDSTDSTETTGASEDDEPTAEEMAAALAAAKADADALVNGGAASVEDFDSLIADLAINDGEEDAASTQYENTFYTKINSKIQEWIGETDRKAGDVTAIEITKTVDSDEEGAEETETTGYYVVYFLERNDNYTNLVSVRHILIECEGGTYNSTTGETTYSDEEKAAAKAEAMELLKQWQSGDATEESFAALANEKSADTGSNENGGLYEDIYPNEMVADFNDWCFDESRQPGETGVIETEYGAHIMYFVQTQDMTYRDYMIENDLISEDLTAWHDALVEKIEVVEVNLSGMEWDITIG